MLTTGLMLGARRAVSAGPVAGSAATVFAVAPTVHYHPHSQAGTVSKSGSRITACPDLRGLAALSGFAADGTTVVGPTEMTDALGRKFWRFNGAEYATIANTLTGLSNRGHTTMAVMRFPHLRTNCMVVNPRFATYVSDASNTIPNGLFGMLRAPGGILGGTNTPGAATNPTDAWKAVVGTGPQVVGVASRSTALGGIRLYNNTLTCDIAQAGSAFTNCLGAVIGGSSSAANTANVTTSVNNVFDIYEIAIWNAELTNTQTDAIAAAMVANWATTNKTRHLFLEGDSITDAIPTTLATSPAWHGSVGTWLTNPGAEMVPANVCVINLGTSGNETADIVIRRDNATGVYAFPVPGGAANNKVAIQIGRNDVNDSAQGQKNSAALYADIVALWNTPTTGFLQRGYSGVQVGNVATSDTTVTINISPPGENTFQKRLEGLRALIADEANKTPNPTFLTDTLSNTGQAYDGLLTVLHSYAISIGGRQWFYDAVLASDYANAVPPGPYDSDNTHLVAEGTLLMATGGDTPQFGYGSLW
jgi:hypothetical protein